MSALTQVPLPGHTLPTLAAEPKWIWCGADGSDSHVWAWARQQFLCDLSDVVRLEITADLRYDVWINGQYVGFGPARSHAATPSVDVYDVSELCSGGCNGIAVRVYSLGAVDEKGGISSCMPQRGALWVRLSCGDDLIVSDEGWRMKADPAYASETASRGETQPPNECFDARRTLGNVWEQAYDDEEWPGAKSVSGPGRESMEVRDIPFPTYHSHAPDRVLQVGVLHFPVAYSELALTEVAAALRDAESSPLDARLIAKGDSMVELPAVGKDCDCAYAIWDLGRVWTGYPSVTLEGKAGAIVDICYGEHLTKGLVDPSKTAMNYFDRVILDGTPFVHTVTWPKCARYVQIVSSGGSVTACLSWFRSTFPVQRAGSIATSSATLDHAVELSLHTVQLCMEDTFMDTPWRERGGWLGDDIVKAQVSYDYFGDYSLARRFLLQHSRGQLSSGAMQGKYPSNVPNLISTWSLRYPASLLEYSRSSGDWSLAREVWPCLTRLVSWILSHRVQNGLFEGPPIHVDAFTNKYNFIDWAPVDTSGANAAWNAFAYKAIADAANIAKVLGETALHQEWNAIAVDTKRNFQTLFWDERRGVFANGYFDGKLTSRWGCHENVLAVLFDLATESQRGQIVERLLSEDLQQIFIPDENDYDVEDPNCGKLPTLSIALNRYRWPDEKMVPIGTPYFAGFWLEALCKLGLVEQAQEFICSRWGEFARQGATSVWETWNQSQSLSHGWSGIPAVLATREFCGIRRDDDEGLSFKVLPALGGLDWILGRVASPQGIIQGLFERKRMMIFVPAGMQGLAGLPAEDGDSLWMNDRVCSDARSIHHNGDRYLVTSIDAGTTTLVVRK